MKTKLKLVESLLKESTTKIGVFDSDYQGQEWFDEFSDELFDEIVRKYTNISARNDEEYIVFTYNSNADYIEDDMMLDKVVIKGGSVIEDTRITESLNKMLSWTCWYEGNDIGTVTAKNKEEAEKAMMSKYPTYDYNNTDWEVSCNTFNESANSESSTAMDSDFVIEDGILKRYTGHESNVVIPNGVTSIGEDAFYKCSSLKAIKIPDSVTRIDKSAFWGCDSLTSIEIPDSVTVISDHAFYDCSSLTSIKIPNSVKIIWNGTFSYCRSLSNIEIPNSVTTIGEEAFYRCDSLTSIVIPNSVTSIGYTAFGHCTSLQSITIPNSVTSIGRGAFWDCNSLTSINYAGTKEEALTILKVKNKTWRVMSSIEKIICTDGVIYVGTKTKHLGESLTEGTDNTTSNSHYGNKIFFILDLMSGDQIIDFMNQYSIYDVIEISEDENDINVIYDAIRRYIDKGSGKDFYHWLYDYCYYEDIFNYYVIAYHDGDKYIYYTDNSKKPFTDDLSDNSIRTYKDKDDAERELMYFSSPDNIFRKINNYHILTDIKVEPTKDNLFVITGKDTDTGDTYYYWGDDTSYDWSKSITDSLLMSKEKAAKELVAAKEDPYPPMEDELFKPVNVRDIISNTPFNESLTSIKENSNKDDKLLKIDTLYRDAINYGVNPESLDKILYSNGADPDAPTFDIGLNVDKAYEELSNFLKKKYQSEFDRDYNDNEIPHDSYNILGFNKLAYKLELERLNKEIANLKDKYNINESKNKSMNIVEDWKLIRHDAYSKDNKTRNYTIWRDEDGEYNLVLGKTQNDSLIYSSKDDYSVYKEAERLGQSLLKRGWKQQ